MVEQRRAVIRLFVLCLGVAGLFLCGLLSQTTGAENVGGGRKAGTIDVLFSPDGGCADRIIKEIDKARKAVRVQMYFFTSKPIADALIAARKRGVKVEVILDSSQEKMTYGRFRVLRRVFSRPYHIESTDDRPLPHARRQHSIGNKPVTQKHFSSAANGIVEWGMKSNDSRESKSAV